MTKTNNTYLKVHKLIRLLILLFLLAYVVVRAITVGITYDEAWTLRTFVPLSISDIMMFNPADANNHILNTLLIKLFFLPGNHSLFIARLPNVLAFALYVFFCFLITKGSSNLITSIFLFILLLFNPFILEFFSLARGYGLALAFQMVSLYYLFRYGNNLSWKKLAISLLFGILAVLSNFTFLYFFLTILLFGIGLSFFHLNINNNFKRVLLTSIIATLLLASMIALPLYKLIQNGGLYYGGDTGFYRDTLVSLFAFYIYHPYNIGVANVVLKIFLFLLASVIFFSIIKMPAEREMFLEGKTIMICILTLVLIVINILNHFITATLYLTDRTALCLIPFLILLLVFWIEELQARKVSLIISVLIISLSLFAMVNFGVHANFTRTLSWPFDAQTQTILERINAIGKKENKIKTVDFSWPFESSVDYYVNKNKYSNLAVSKDVSDREKLNPRADFYIYYAKSLDKVGYAADKQAVIKFQKDTVWKFDKEDILVFSHLDTTGLSTKQ